MATSMCLGSALTWFRHSTAQDIANKQFGQGYSSVGENRDRCSVEEGYKPWYKM